jgi:hypothetical protein
MALKFGMEKFNLMKLKVVRVRQKYRLKISKFSGFGKLCGHKSGLWIHYREHQNLSCRELGVNMNWSSINNGFRKNVKSL